jgi:hypothetical protein
VPCHCDENPRDMTFIDADAIPVTMNWYTHYIWFMATLESSRVKLNTVVGRSDTLRALNSLL